MDAKIYFWPQKIYDWTHPRPLFSIPLQSKIVSNMNINILAATAAFLSADILAWCFPLVVIVASAIGFGFAAYYWGRNARIENYLRRRKEETDRASRQNQPN